jgi:hypothetical protein
MTRFGMQRSTGLRRCALVATMALTVALVSAVPALATEPTGDFSVFKECPVSNPEVNACVYAQSVGGEFHFGNAIVPIDKTITFQGGTIVNPETGEETFVAATNGETMSKTPLLISGDLFGGVRVPRRGWPRRLRRIIDRGIGRVTATIELVANPGISRLGLLLGNRIALELPVRLHLRNPFLGDRCYIGSAADPVLQRLTTGTTSPPAPYTPITGKVGELEIAAEGRIIIVKKNLQVDNTYAAPAAEGCGGFFSFLIDPALNARLGLPSPAGTNTTALEATLETTSAGAVLSSEE